MLKKVSTMFQVCTSSLVWMFVWVVSPLSLPAPGSSSRWSRNQWRTAWSWKFSSGPLGPGLIRELRGIFSSHLTFNTTTLCPSELSWPTLPFSQVDNAVESKLTAGFEENLPWPGYHSHGVLHAWLYVYILVIRGGGRQNKQRKISNFRKNIHIRLYNTPLPSHEGWWLPGSWARYWPDTRRHRCPPWPTSLSSAPRYRTLGRNGSKNVTL